MAPSSALTDHDLLDLLNEIALSRGVDLRDMLTDFFAADERFRKVCGRTVVCSEAGVPALADECNKTLGAFPDSAARIRGEMLRLAGIDAGPIGFTLADAIVAVGKRKKARYVLEHWGVITDALRPTT
jgi:hypothetical protein